ncbi:MAG: ComEC/Rec2 family competence protein [Burkholderiaceae bacterium]
MPRMSSAWAVPLVAGLLPWLPSLPPMPWLVLAAVPAVLLLPASRQRGWLRFGCCALIAFALMAGQARSGLDARLPAHLEGVDLQVEGDVVSTISRHSHGVSFRFHVRRCTRSGGDPACALSGVVRLAWYGRHPLPASLWPGDRLHLNVRLKRPIGMLNPGGFDTELWALREGVIARGHVRADRAGLAPAQRNGLRSGVSWSGAIMLAQLRMRVSAIIDQALREGRCRWSGCDQRPGDRAPVGDSARALGHVQPHRGVAPDVDLGLHVTMFAAMSLWLFTRLLRLHFPGMSG